MRCELIIERDGVVVYKGISKSFVKNFGLMLAGMLKNPGDGGAARYVEVIDTTGFAAKACVEVLHDAVSRPFGPMAFSAGDNDDSYGIVVGSGSTPPSPADCALASKISHGTGPGQLDYDTHSVIASYSATSSYIDFYRIFVNKSSEDVVVREVGLIARSWCPYVGVDVKFLVARDVLPSPVIVKPLESLTVRYRLSLALT